MNEFQEPQPKTPETDMEFVDSLIAKIQKSNLGSDTYLSAAKIIAENETLQDTAAIEKLKDFLKDR